MELYETRFFKGCSRSEIITQKWENPPPQLLLYVKGPYFGTHIFDIQ
jgi:hypothetical protein